MYRADCIQFFFTHMYICIIQYIYIFTFYNIHFFNNKEVVVLVSCQVSGVFSISSLRVSVGNLRWCFQKCSMSLSPDPAEIDTQLRRPPCQAGGESGCPPSRAKLFPHQTPFPVESGMSPAHCSCQVRLSCIDR